MANNSESNNINQENMEEQKDQFRNFVEGVTGGNGSNAVTQDKSRVADEQNRMIDKHNLRK